MNLLKTLRRKLLIFCSWKSEIPIGSRKVVVYARFIIKAEVNEPQTTFGFNKSSTTQNFVQCKPQMIQDLDADGSVALAAIEKRFICSHEYSAR